MCVSRAPCTALHAGSASMRCTATFARVRPCRGAARRARVCASDTVPWCAPNRPTKTGWPLWPTKGRRRRFKPPCKACRPRFDTSASALNWCAAARGVHHRPSFCTWALSQVGLTTSRRMCRQAGMCPCCWSAATRTKLSQRWHRGWRRAARTTGCPMGMPWRQPTGGWRWPLPRARTAGTRPNVNAWPACRTSWPSSAWSRVPRAC